MSSRATDVFGAIADPTRRSILDLLREQGSATAGEIASVFSGVTRPAVSKHLGVLRRAGLVQAEEKGRQWHYRLDARPLGAMYELWLGNFAPYWEESLERLKRQAESG